MKITYDNQLEESPQWKIINQASDFDIDIYHRDCLTSLSMVNDIVQTKSLPSPTKVLLVAELMRTIKATTKGI